MGLVAKIRGRMGPKPLTAARVQRLAEAAAAREDLDDFRVAAKSGHVNRIQLEKQLGAIARRPR